MRVKIARRVRVGFRCIGFVVFLMACSVEIFAQNSPYSQRGPGSPVRNHNILNTAMGGVSEAYADGQTLNFINPASYADLKLTTFDAGINMGSLSIRNQDTSSFRSGFGSLSYLMLGFPLKKGGGWGLTFGLTPETRIKYNINRSDSTTDIGSPVSYLYKGTGGAYKAFAGTGYAIKGFRFGVNFGYLFGSKQETTETYYLSDSLNYYNSTSRERTGYGAFFWDAGLQTHIKLGKNLGLELGASGGLKTNLKGNRDFLMENIYYSGGDPTPKNDTVRYASNDKGTIVYPGHYGFGLLLHNTGGKGNWTIGADYEATQWSDYSFYGTPGTLQDSRTLRFGAQLVPSMDPRDNSYWKKAAYRIGFYTTKGNFKSNNVDVNEYAFSLGVGFPIRNFMPNNEYTLINTALEIGKRGSDSNLLNESFIRFSVGFTLSDIWFINHRYQ